MGHRLLGILNFIYSRDQVSLTKGWVIMSSNRNENRTKPVIISIKREMDETTPPATSLHKFDEREGLRRAAEYLHLAKLSLKTGNSRMHEDLLDSSFMEELRVECIKTGYLVIMIEVFSNT
jgi:hypothetical protein